MPIKKIVWGAARARRPASGAVAKVAPKFKPRKPAGSRLGKAVNAARGVVKKAPLTAVAVTGAVSYRAGKKDERKRKQRR